MLSGDLSRDLSLIFIDTSAFYAASDKSDQFYTIAKGLFEKIQKDRLEIVTHNYVVVETVALLQRRLGHMCALRFLKSLDEIAVFFIDNALQSKSLEKFKTHVSTKISFVDCVSFIFMEHQKIKTFFGFDSHFKKSGFKDFL